MDFILIITEKVEGGAEMETLSEIFPAEFTESSSTVVEGGGL